jgi:osmotically-inducible protein OsmY
MNGLRQGICVLLVFLMAACAATSTRKSTGQVIDDTVIASKVKAYLVGDSVVKARQIDVEVYKGVVTLNGFVDSQEQIDRAVDISQGVEGVKDVISHLELKEVHQ